MRNQHIVILIDRGLLDGSAFVSKTAWQALVDELGSSTINLRDNRYDAVIHMVTAADGAESFYETVTNEARYHTAEGAREVDKRLREAYMGHHRWFMVDNPGVQFDQKVAKTKETIYHILG